MVKIRSYISKKSVPRGIDINDKEYWQPFGIIVKRNNYNNNSNNNGNNGNGGNNGGNNNGQNQNIEGKCHITVITTPSETSVSATDSEGNVYETKDFYVNKGVQITLVTVPNPSLTGYVQNTKLISSDETNQDSLVVNVVLERDEANAEYTDITILADKPNVAINVFDENNTNLSNGSNIVRDILVGSIISVSAIKEGYVLTTCSHGTKVGTGENTKFTNITVVKNMVINVGLEQNNGTEPSIFGLENDYLVTPSSQDWSRGFRFKGTKLRIYGDLVVSFLVDNRQSSSDSLGGQSITIDNTNNIEKQVIVYISIPENTNVDNRTFSFTAVAENANGSTSKQFNLVQTGTNTVTHKVGIVTKINNSISNDSTIIRKINGTAILPNEQINVIENSLVSAEATCLGVTKTKSNIITERYDFVFDFTVHNITLGSCNVSANNRILVLEVQKLGINTRWDGSAIRASEGDLYRVTGVDNSGVKAPYDSGWRSVDGNPLHIIFEDYPDPETTNVTINVVDDDTSSVISGATVVLTRRGSIFANGTSFVNGERIGYRVEASGYNSVEVGWDTNQAIIAGTSPNPYIVRLTAETPLYTVTLNVIDENNNPLVPDSLDLLVDGQNYANGSSFEEGTHIGYQIFKDGYDPIIVEEGDVNEIIVANSNYTDTIQMTPSNGTDYSIDISGNITEEEEGIYGKIVQSEGEIININVSTGASDYIVRNQSNWLNVTKTEHGVRIVVLENTGSQRVANVDFVVPSQTVRLIITQLAGQVSHTLEVDRNVINFRQDGTIATNANIVTVTTNAQSFDVDYRNAFQPDWISYEREGNSIIFTATHNSGYSRTCYVDISAPGAETVTITINQSGEQNEGLHVYNVDDGDGAVANKGEELLVAFANSASTKRIYIATPDSWEEDDS